MFLTIWNFLRGYVIIEVSGFSVERFINMAVYRGILLWNVKRSPERATMCVSIKAFKLLKPCSQKTKCRVRIIEKRGLPFVTFRYRRRKLLVLGVVAFMAFLFFLSGFVWYVGVNGTERLNADEIVTYLEEQGLFVGVRKSTLNRKELQNALIAEYPEISWVNLEIKGTRVTVHLVEGIPDKEIEDKTSPTDIIAAKDGLITDIATSVGTPQVKAGDVVTAGDVLVSGLLTIGNDETGITHEYVHAKAAVRAKTYYNISFAVPYSYYESQAAGETAVGYSFAFLGLRIGLFNQRPDFITYEDESERFQLSFGEDYPLPFIMVKHTYREYTNIEMERSAEEAEIYAEKLLYELLANYFSEDAEVLDTKAEYTDTGTELEVKVFVEVVESIGVEQSVELQVIDEIESEDTDSAEDALE